MPLPPVRDIAAQMPEALAPSVLEDFVAQGLQQSHQVDSYSTHFDIDVNAQGIPYHEREPIARSLAEAVAYLEQLGFIARDPRKNTGTRYYFVTRRGRDAAASPAAFASNRVRALFPAAVFHEALRGSAFNALVASDFQQAVSEAFRIIEVRVRDASGLTSLHGADLMRAAFHEKSGPLRSNAHDKNERESLAHLFAGAYGWLRNPAAHRDVPKDATSAVEQLMFASLLLRVLDDHRAP